MADSSAGGAAFLGAEEIINDGRTLAYLENGYGPSTLKVNGGCACPRIRELAECNSDPYDTPATDPAPWYDASTPESADFAGFLTTEFEGLGSTYIRESINKITGGAVLGRLRPEPRTLTWRGFLFGRSCCAVQYGLRWMIANLVGSNCNCGGEDLDLLICCPEVSGITEDCIGELAQPVACPPFNSPNAFRTLKNVGLVSGPTILSERKVGCGSSFCGGCAGDENCIIEIEFSLSAGNPYLYGCPVCLCVEETFPVNEECVEFIEVPPGTIGDCPDFVCPPDEDCTLDMNGCDSVVLPVFPAFEDSCFCTPIDAVQFCCDVPADSFGQFFDGVPVIEIFSGPTVLRNTSVRFFNNALGESCCDVGADPCLECDSIFIRFIPASSTLLIDGTTRQVTLLCPGSSEPVTADHLTVSPFSWPVLKCNNYCICIETDASVSPDPLTATVTVSVVPREM